MIGSTFTVEFNGGIQYNYFFIDSVEFDSFDEAFIDSKYPKEYSVKPYSPQPKLPLLSNGTNAPDIIGVKYPTGDTVRLSDYKGKLVLLDFFYTTCFPCIQAIPHLQATYEKYKDSGVVVLGIDPLEYLETDKKKLDKFFERIQVDYPIVLAYSAGDDYHVNGYPTMYIIDKTGKIIHSSVGYGEKAELVWEEMLSKVLRE
jgi:peroxiredoxin